MMSNKSTGFSNASGNNSKSSNNGIKQRTHQEWISQVRRGIADAKSRMAGGPLYALAMGSTAVSLLSIGEGFLCIKPNNLKHNNNNNIRTTALTFYQKMMFVTRYSISQLIPSIVWATQSPTTIAQLLKLNPTLFYADPMDASPWRTLNLNRLRALRGAIAGSVILSQVFSLMDVISHSQEAYQQRIRIGKEPPLEDASREGVVIRLAGENSITTNLTMAREGRRHIFPVFEDTTHPDVCHLVQVHSPAGSSSSDSNTFNTKNDSTGIPQVPIYWHVQNGRYSHATSWQGLVIPETWLFTLPNQEKLLFLEADATLGNNTSMSLKRGETSTLDLDLYEVAQGFTQLSRLVMINDVGSSKSKHNASSRQPSFQVMRILLVDPDATYQSGGGRQITARHYITELGLADVIVDARTPILQAMKRWLTNFYQEDGRELTVASKRPRTKRSKVVILETPERDWFLSIQHELERLGYTVIDQDEATQKFKSLENIPFFVYEKQTADTFHTVQQYVKRDLLQPHQICALCPRPWSLEALLDDRVPGVTYICSAELHDQLLEWVREKAVLDGWSAQQIQSKLDSRIQACE